jgi:hypothetical protein
MLGSTLHPTVLVMSLMVSSYLRKVKGRLAPISMVGWDLHHITRARSVIFFQLLWVSGLKEKFLKRWGVVVCRSTIHRILHWRRLSSTAFAARMGHFLTIQTNFSTLQFSSLCHLHRAGPRRHAFETDGDLGVSNTSFKSYYYSSSYQVISKFGLCL